MNFRSEIVSQVLSTLNWATAAEGYKPGENLLYTLPSLSLLIFLLAMAPPDVPVDQARSDRHRTRLNKRKEASDMLTNTREELFAGEFDG
jgi:tRNA (adenine-N(1)-)-methyltransferase non-catalytic subunit